MSWDIHDFHNRNSRTQYNSDVIKDKEVDVFSAYRGYFNFLITSKLVLVKMAWNKTDQK